MVVLHQMFIAFLWKDNIPIFSNGEEEHYWTQEGYWCYAYYIPESMLPSYMELQ